MNDSYKDLMILKNLFENFTNVLNSNDTSKTIEYLEKNASFEAFAYNTYDPNLKGILIPSLLYEIILSGNEEIIDYVLLDSSYTKNEYFLDSISKNISTCFGMFCYGNSIEELEKCVKFHEKVMFHSEVLIKNHNSIPTRTKNVDSEYFLEFGLNTKECYRVDGKFGIRNEPIINGFDNALYSKRQDTDMLDFIYKIKDRCQLSDVDFNFNLEQVFSLILGNKEKKADYILDKLSLNYDEELFKKAYGFYNKNKSSKRTTKPLMKYLILSKEIPYTEEIKALVKDDSEIIDMFVFDELKNNLPINNATKKANKI